MSQKKTMRNKKKSKKKVNEEIKSKWMDTVSKHSGNIHNALREWIDIKINWGNLK